MGIPELKSIGDGLGDGLEPFAVVDEGIYNGRPYIFVRSHLKCEPLSQADGCDMPRVIYFRDRPYYHPGAGSCAISRDIPYHTYVGR